eukprot:scaffold34683_cov99-Amphora_coffeaeformis.AAC.1
MGKVDASCYLPEYRFQQIQQFISLMYAEKDQADDDPWWQISKLWADFNENRSRTVSPCSDQVLDEFMSYRTTPIYSLPMRG